MSWYAIVKVDITKRHSIVIIIWRTSAIKKPCIIKNPLSEMKNMQEKESIKGVRDR